MLVKSVSALADHVRPNGHADAFSVPGPILGGIYQQCSRSFAPLSFADYQAIDFRAPGRLQQMAGARMQPANDFALGGFGYKDSMIGEWRYAAQAGLHLVCGGGVSQLLSLIHI